MLKQDATWKKSSIKTGSRDNQRCYIQILFCTPFNFCEHQQKFEAQGKTITFPGLLLDTLNWKWPAAPTAIIRDNEQQVNFTIFRTIKNRLKSNKYNFNRKKPAFILGGLISFGKENFTGRPLPFCHHKTKGIKNHSQKPGVFDTPRQKEQKLLSVAQWCRKIKYMVFLEPTVVRLQMTPLKPIKRAFELLLWAELARQNFPWLYSPAARLLLLA